jgi:hypothetical protein
MGERSTSTISVDFSPLSSAPPIALCKVAWTWHSPDEEVIRANPFRKTWVLIALCLP